MHRFVRGATTRPALPRPENGFGRLPGRPGPEPAMLAALAEPDGSASRTFPGSYEREPR